MDSEKNQIDLTATEEAVSTDINDLEDIEIDVDNTTIFTDENNIKEPKKIKSSGTARLPVLIGALVILIVAIGVLVFAGLFEPADDTSNDSGISIEVKTVDATKISKIEIKNKNTEMVLYSEVVDDEGVDDDTGVYTTGVTWMVEGYDSSLIASSSVNALADNIANITSSKIMTNQNLDYGFDDPTVVANVTMRDGNGNYTVTIGDMAPDKTGYYLTVSGDTNIYFVTVGSVSSLHESVEQLADTVIVSTPTKDENTKASDRKYFDDEGTLATFESISITGTHYGKDIVFTAVKDNDMADYLVTIGENFRYAHSDTVEDMFGILTNGIVAIDTYKLNPTEEDIKNYGLENPEFNVTVNCGSYTTTIHASMYDEDNEYYAVTVDGRNGIYAVTAAALSMLDYEIADFYNEYVFLEYLKDIKTLHIENADGEFTFEIKYNESKSITRVILDGYKLDEDIFATYYQYIVDLSPEVPEDEEYVDGEASYRATFTFNDTDKADIVLELIKQTDRRFLVVIDGQKMGLVSSADYDALVTYLQYAIKGKEIPEV